VRILTVCDVYDALVSERVYRTAWTPKRAFELLRAESGKAFCPECVETLSRVVGAEPEPAFVTDLAPSARLPATAPGPPSGRR
jgi:HD-GYP domain-containing protein (c-di-GMP phosphodiesterase class II)